MGRPANLKNKNLIERNVIIDPDTGCWNWQLHVTKDGHAMVSIKGSSLSVAPIVWELWHGEIPLDDSTHTGKKYIRHSCSNKKCCNPEHLELGSNSPYFENNLELPPNDIQTDGNSDKEFIARRVIIDPDTGCWNWQLRLNKTGYGTVSWNDKTSLAHRVAWEIWNGPIPKSNSLKNPFGTMIVGHSCDNPQCVAPHHLFLGEPQDNTNDMLAKGREPKTTGHMHYNDKITSDEQALEIIDKYSWGSYTYKLLGAEYGLSDTHICALVKRQTWPHLIIPEDTQRRLDTMNRKKAPKGESHLNAKLNDDIVREIKRRNRNGESQTALAKEFGVNKSTISSILRGKIWKHIT